MGVEKDVHTQDVLNPLNRALIFASSMGVVVNARCLDVSWNNLLSRFVVHHFYFQVTRFREDELNFVLRTVNL